MIEQTQAQQTQAQAPKRPASSVPLLVGGAFFAGIAAFLGWGVWEATHPGPVPNCHFSSSLITLCILATMSG